MSELSFTAARAVRPHLPVLLVEDNAVLRDTLSRLFEDDGFGVVTAIDGEDALRRLRAGLTPCLIVLDLIMPRKDGFAFRAEQMQEPRLADLPTIAYSFEPAFEARARALGMVFLRKPFDLDAVIELVRKHCARS